MSVEAANAVVSQRMYVQTPASAKSETVSGGAQLPTTVDDRHRGSDEHLAASESFNGFVNRLPMTTVNGVILWVECPYDEGACVHVSR
jgi:alpha-D-ribose 1-methylphosphonate 5-triphosphate synthase subunit PhnI